MKKLFIFDFDGTLVDTITDVAICFNEALKINGFPQHPLKAYDGFVGGNLETVVSRMLPPRQVNETNINAVKTTYRSLYMASRKENTKPYPGILPLLEQLKKEGYLLAVNSNKGQELLDELVNKMFPPNFFDAVIGYVEGVPSKPDPYGVEKICKICGVSKENAVYIGDGKSDIDTAANAGVTCIFVMWGQGSDADKCDERVCCRADTPADLKDKLLKKV